MRTRMEGLVIAEVVDVNDPTGEGRVLLRYSDMPGPLNGTWAPIASGMSGPGRGAYFMPEPGDEVLVGFHHGKFNFPFVLGFLWNGEHLPPESDTQNRVFVTRTGHSLRFEDGNKKVILKSGGGRTITLDDNTSTITVETGATKITLDGSTVTATSGGSSITMDGSSITLAGGGRQIALSGGSVAIT